MRYSMSLPYKYHKHRYLELRKRLQGGHTFCERYGFVQHSAECWSDSIQTIFCFADGFKERTQSIFSSSRTTNEIILTSEKSRKPYFLPPNMFTLEFTSDTPVVTPVGELTEFHDISVLLLDNIRTRFLIHHNFYYGRHFTPEAQGHATRTAEVRYGKQGQKVDIDGNTLHRSQSGDYSVNACISSKRLSALNSGIHFIRLKTSATNHGDYLDATLMIWTLSYLLLSGNEFVYIYQADEEEYNIDHSVIDNATGVYVASFGHAMAFITCNGTEFFYDNELLEMVEFPWKEYLKALYSDAKLHIFWDNRPDDSITAHIRRRTKYPTVHILTIKEASDIHEYIRYNGLPLVYISSLYNKLEFTTESQLEISYFITECDIQYDMPPMTALYNIILAGRLDLFQILLSDPYIRHYIQQEDILNKIIKSLRLRGTNYEMLSFLEDLGS